MAPVVKLLSPLAKNSTALATSSVVASRPSGMPWLRCVLNSSSLREGSASLRAISPGVSVAAGLTVLTRMPREPNSLAQMRASERTAAFVAAYILVPGRPRSAATDEFKMIEPCSLIRGSSA